MTHFIRRNGPVRKQQVVPDLLHDPGTRAEREWAVRGNFQKLVHGTKEFYLEADVVACGFAVRR